MASFRRKHGRKLLLASIGVATVTYIGCEEQTSGNLIAYPCDQDPNCVEASSSSSSGGGEGGQGGAAGQGGMGMGGTGGAGQGGAGGANGTGGAGGIGGGK